MKWPTEITLLRHAETEYNTLKRKKEADPEYQEFKKLFEEDFYSPRVLELAQCLKKRFALGKSDYETWLTTRGEYQAYETGKRLKDEIELPDAILISPYLRTRQTYCIMSMAWPELGNVRTIPYDRVREQEHGLANLYNDWRIFFAFHPEQKELYDQWEELAGYWYRWPQGESAADVRARTHSMTDTIIREYAGERVLILTHHLTILSFRADYERFSPKQFIELDNKEKPKNCGVTIYHGNPRLGKNGKLELACYNRCFYDEHI